MPENFISYVRGDHTYIRDDVDPIYRGKPIYKLRVRWKPNKCSLTYATDCQMSVVE